VANDVFPRESHHVHSVTISQDGEDAGGSNEWRSTTCAASIASSSYMNSIAAPYISRYCLTIAPSPKVPRHDHDQHTTVELHRAQITCVPVHQRRFLDPTCATAKLWRSGNWKHILW